MLAGPLPGIRKKLLCQFVGFCHKLKSSASWEVRVLASIADKDVERSMGKNLRNGQQEFNMCPWKNTDNDIRKESKDYPVPHEDCWRLPFLRKLLEQRREMMTCEEDISTITSLVDSLCSS